MIKFTYCTVCTIRVLYTQLEFGCILRYSTKQRCIFVISGFVRRSKDFLSKQRGYHHARRRCSFVAVLQKFIFKDEATRPHTTLTANYDRGPPVRKQQCRLNKMMTYKMDSSSHCSAIISVWASRRSAFDTQNANDGTYLARSSSSARVLQGPTVPTIHLSSSVYTRIRSIRISIYCIVHVRVHTQTYCINLV